MGHDGAAVRHDYTRYRSPLLDAHDFRILRARTFAAWRLQGYSPKAISDALNYGITTVKDDLAWLALEQFAGRNTLPTDPPPGPDDVDRP